MTVLKRLSGLLARKAASERQPDVAPIARPPALEGATPAAPEAVDRLPIMPEEESGLETGVEAAAPAELAEAALPPAPQQPAPKPIAVPTPTPPKPRDPGTGGGMDAFAIQQSLPPKANGARGDEAEEIFFPPFERTFRQPVAPPPGITFMFPTSLKLLPATEMAVLSLLDVYPQLASRILLVMEEEAPAPARRRFARLSDRIAFVVPPEGWAASFASVRGEDLRQRLTLFALTLTGHERVIVLQPDALVLGDISEAWHAPGLAMGHDVTDAGFVARSRLTGEFALDTSIISLPGNMTGPDAVAEMAGHLVNRAGSCRILDKRPIQRAWNLFARDREKTVLPLRCCVSAMYVLKCLDGSRQGVCLLHDNGEEPWSPTGGK